MKEPEDFSFEDRAGFHAAVLHALAACRHEVMLVDPDLRAWPFESAPGERALQDALRRGVRFRVLLGDTGWVERQSTRFMRTRRNHDAAIACRRLPPGLRLDDSVLLGDRQHLLRRAHPDGYRGRCIIASPSQVEAMRQRLDAAWDESETALPSTVLGLAR